VEKMSKKIVKALKRLLTPKQTTTKEQKPKRKTSTKYYVCSECGFVCDAEECEDGTLPCPICQYTVWDEDY
jgi:rubrerythrin